LPELAADLVRHKVDVIVATGELPSAARATSTIPVVFTIGSDPVQSGLVASIARPDGNITGFTAIATQLVSKRFELVSELLPQAKKIAVLINSRALAVSEVTIGLAQQAVGPKGIQLLILKADDGSSLEAAFASIAQEHADAIVVSADAFFFLRREQITAFCQSFYF
jgi:putative ABC transport system substrate-binding protein